MGQKEIKMDLLWIKQVSGIIFILETIFYIIYLIYLSPGLRVLLGSQVGKRDIEFNVEKTPPT
jgi:ABC-type methionine transport system permease subunit